MDVMIRPEEPLDLRAIRGVNLAAFPNAGEANLVDKVRANGKATLSLVAVQDDRIVGHILFSPVTIESNRGQHLLLGLAPMAVLPYLQRQGIGSQLVEEGLVHSRRVGAGCVVVLGHSDYYPRFGFKTASQVGISCLYDVPDERFMVVQLVDGALSDISGLVRYQPEFASV